MADAAAEDAPPHAAETAARYAAPQWLPYEKQIMTDMVDQDALLVMAKGLGIHRVFAHFLRLYASSETLVLCLNANEYVPVLEHLVLALGLDRKFLPRVIDAKTTAQERIQQYKHGGCFFVTSRILVVDLLNGKLDGARITGLLVHDAHRVIETSVEAFIVRLYREVNRQGFLKAFSDDATAFSAGFNKMEQVLKHLYLCHVHLYPRFHVSVHACLSQRQPEVYEIEVAYSACMRVMQEAILVAMDATMKELQRRTKALDASELSMERALAKSFATAVRHQLDPVWHKLPPKTKQLVGDLTTLRQLLAYLPRYDAISFYSFLLNHQIVNGQQRFPSPWLFTEAADRLIAASKQRLYQLVDTRNKQPIARNGNRDPDTKKTTDNTLLQRTLEGNPKWKALLQILDDVEQERIARTMREADGDGSSGPSIMDDSNDSGAQVLIMCKDEHTCAQLRELLTLGETQMMERRFGQYLLQKEAVVKRHGGALGVEQQLVLKAAADFRARVRAMQNAPRDHKTSNSRKRALEPSSSMSNRTDSTGFGMSLQDLQAAAMAQDARVQNGKYFAGEAKTGEAIGPQRVKSSVSKLSIEFVPRTDHIVLCTYEHALQHGLGACSLLQDLHPSSVVLYDPDMAFVRELEVFAALQSRDHALEIFFMLYAESAEQQTYLSEIRKEKQAFEALIYQKAHLMMPANVYDVPYHVKARQLQQPAYSMDTRTGGRAKSGQAVQVVVDVREFRCALPSMLHKGALLVQPVTLEVGDYILSPQICVERKSVSDLFSSLNSGRLFHQAEQMGRFYDCPVLLIEFTPGKAFALQDAADLGTEISASSIISKLTLLVLHFPKLRLLWSRSPHATVDLFKTVKQRQAEPDVDVAMAVGTRQQDKESADTKTKAKTTGTAGTSNAGPSTFYNTSSIDLLRKLPGVTDHNYRHVLSKVKNLAELSRMSRADMCEMLGKVCGKRLYAFFNTPI